MYYIFEFLPSKRLTSYFHTLNSDARSINISFFHLATIDTLFCMDLISCSLKVLFATLDSSSFHYVYYRFPMAFSPLILCSTWVSAPEDDSSRSVETSIVTATIRWDGMEYCLFMTTTLTERSVNAWKEHVLPYSSSPRKSLKIIVHLLLLSSRQHDGVLVPVMSLPIQLRTANL